MLGIVGGPRTQIALRNDRAIAPLLSYFVIDGRSGSVAIVSGRLSVLKGRVDDEGLSLRCKMELKKALIELQKTSEVW